MLVPYGRKKNKSPGLFFCHFSIIREKFSWSTLDMRNFDVVLSIWLQMSRSSWQKRLLFPGGSCSASKFGLNIYTKGSLHFLNISYAFSYKLVNLIDNPFVDLLQYTAILNETCWRSRKDTRLNISRIPALHVLFKIVLREFSKNEKED